MLTKRLAALVISLALGLGLAELGLRLIERGRDDHAFAWRLVKDPIFQRRMPASRYGHDANGFRNDRVADSAGIVVLGDSQSWGINVQRQGNWPSELSRVTGQTVYNMGMVGWGPAQYLEALPTAIALKPRTVILQLYFGNDFLDAYRATYELEHFAARRLPSPPLEFVHPSRPNVAKTDAADRPPPASVWRRLALGRFLRQSWDREQLFTDLARQSERTPDDVVVVNGSSRTIIRLDIERALLDTGQPAIAEGRRLTLAYLDTIRAMSDQVHLLVLIFPGKATAYAKRSAHAGLHAVAAQQAQASTMVLEWCRTSSITCVEVASEFQEAIDRGEAVYPITDEVHPTAKGYQIVATKVALALRERGW